VAYGPAVSINRTKRLPRAVFLVGCAAALVTVVLGVVIAERCTEVQWGPVADWLSGTGTIIAIWFAIRALNEAREQNKLTRDELEISREEQKLARQTMEATRAELEDNRLTRERQIAIEQERDQRSHSESVAQAQRLVSNLSAVLSGGSGSTHIVIYNASKEVSVFLARLYIDADGKPAMRVENGTTVTAATDKGLDPELSEVKPGTSAFAIGKPREGWRVEVEVGGHWFWAEKSPASNMRSSFQYLQNGPTLDPNPHRLGGG